MNIADANMLNKLSPFFAILISIPVMKEKPGRKDWAGGADRFSGCAVHHSSRVQALHLFRL
jgi:drug/metabolite transporter (DMT)-like permease